jgi:beta-galactosidase
VTSYDYDAPINEQGLPTAKYFALRDLIAKYLGRPPEVPQAIPAMEVPAIQMAAFTSIWNHLPKPVLSVQPKPLEAYRQDYGIILYRTRLLGHKSGTLTITDLHDYATIFLNSKFVGTLDRREGQQTLEIPKSNISEPLLENLVEGMGRINFAQAMIDRKGITDRVTLNGMTLMDWEVYNFPLDSDFFSGLKSTLLDIGRRGFFFRGNFELDQVADTYIDMTRYRKGLVWVNRHNLGRFWEIGPQKRLYCPAPFLSRSKNEIIVFDLLQTEAKPIQGMKTLE